MILNSIQLAAIPEDTRRNERAHENNESVGRIEDQNTLFAFGETMADLAHELRLETDPFDLTEWCGHNESTLQMLGMFT